MNIEQRILGLIPESVKGLIPESVKRSLRIRRQKKELQQIQRLECDVEYLKSMNDIDLRGVFASHEIEIRWNDAKKRIDMCAIPDEAGTGGINLGDRRAMFYLISRFKPSSVLEIGTHVGASTVHIASALFVNQISKDGRRAQLVSVDIEDVNDAISKPWLKYGTKYSPMEMITKMDCGAFVEFITADSLDYLADCDSRFDFIFLDGDHQAKTVYQEVPAVLNLLNDDGMILLHDYYPNLRPLFSNGKAAPGPFWAIERLKNEGANIVVIPLGELPWPTKLKSNNTTLALLLRNE